MKLQKLYQTSKKFADDQSQSFSDEEQILLQHGLIPIQKGGTSFLGKGEYSKVYKVSYKGKQMVAKITDSERDAENIKTLYEIGNHVGELKRHIPIVYGILTHERENQFPQYIILVEELIPINTNLEAIWYGEKPEEVIKILINPDDVKNIIENMINAPQAPLISEDYLDQFNIDYDVFIDELTELLIHLMKPLSDKNLLKRFKSEDEKRKISATIGNLFYTGMKKIIKQKSNFVPGPKQDRFIRSIEYKISVIKNTIHQFILKLLNESIVFPKSHKMYDKDLRETGFSPYEYLPETKSLMHLLKTLRNYGILWSDLHHENLMERPSTKDIVISDPGLFQLL